METKQMSQSNVKVKSGVKTAIPQPPYSKEFKDQLIEIYNSGVYESAAERA